MAKSTITRERLQEIAEDGFLKHGESKELARMALAAMDSEPVAYRWNYGGTTIWRLLDTKPGPGSNPRCPRVIETLYRHAQPAPERDQVRSEHAEWSQATFGNVGPIGPLKHLRREVLETIAKPHDLIEWADMQFLLWDAQRRAGITDEQITQAMIEKLAVNKQREWPEPKDGEPRLHIKEQLAPVVLDAIPVSRDIDAGYLSGWNDYRAAMLQAGNAPALSPSREHFISLCNEFWNWSEMDLVCADEKGYEPTMEWNGTKFTHRVTQALWRMYQAAPTGIPVIPDGYVMVSVDLLSELRDWAHPEIEKYCEMWKGRRDSEFPALRKVIADADAMLAAAPQEVKSES